MLPLTNTKPIIGLAGGIGSGKSTVARLMGTMGGYVIDADALAREALGRPEIAERLVEWWGSEILDAEGRVDRRRVADRVFHDPAERQRLEQLIHPLVGEERDRRLNAARADPRVPFIVLDVPLLFEVGLDKACDYVFFIDADAEVRLRRVQQTRGWDRAELERREKNQASLDKKRDGSDGIITNNGDEAQCLAQIRSMLDRILSGN